MDALLDAEIYCLGTQDQDNKVQFRILETPEGDQAIPFFLSLEHIQNELGMDVDYVTLNTRKLFEMTQGAILVLNPSSDIAKEFSPEEIQSILNMDVE